MARAPVDLSLAATSAKRSRRFAEILDILQEHPTISLNVLATQLRVSRATARRDLADLADRGLLMRTHGGAQAIDTFNELPVALRDSRFRQAKRAIAEAVVALVPQRRYAVALSGGSTTAMVARALAGHQELTIVTNSLSIAQIVTSYPHLKVIMTGGFLRPQSLELVGVLDENTFNAINPGTAILGADGVTTAGVTTHDETEARTNNAMVLHAQNVIVVADGSKIGRLALAGVATLDQISTLVTDSTADPDVIAAIRASGPEVIVVNAPPG